MNPVVSAWANVDDGCPITCNVSGSDVAHLMIGDSGLEVEFDAGAMRTLVLVATAALTEMDARFEREQVGRPAELSA